GPHPGPPPQAGVGENHGDVGMGSTRAALLPPPLAGEGGGGGRHCAAMPGSPEPGRISPHQPRTTSMSALTVVSIRRATLPTTSSWIAPRPCVPSTTRSAPTLSTYC